MSDLLNNIAKSCYPVNQTCHFRQILSDGTIIMHNTPMELGVSHLLEIHDKKTLCMYRLIIDVSKGKPNAIIVKDSKGHFLAYSPLSSTAIYKMLRSVKLTGLDGNIATVLTFHDVY